MKSPSIREIPSFKSSFGTMNWHIPIVLRIVGRERIRSISDVNKELVEAFIAFLKSRGRQAAVVDYRALSYNGETFEGRKAHKRYLISQLYSLAIPSCINLGLVSQEEHDEMLTFTGRKLLDYMNKKRILFVTDDDETASVFAKVVSYQDSKNWLILSTLLRHDGGLAIEDLIKELQNSGVNVNVSETTIKWLVRRRYLEKQGGGNKKGTWRSRELQLTGLDDNLRRLVNQRVLGARIKKVRNLLNILQSLKLIENVGDKYYARTEILSRLESVRIFSEAKNISKEHFFQTLKRHYDMSRRSQKFVAIPILRDLVSCELGIPWEDFDGALIALGFEYSKFRIILMPPITTKVWGIYIGGKNYYYISIEEGG